MIVYICVFLISFLHFKQLNKVKAFSKTRKMFFCHRRNEAIYACSSRDCPVNAFVCGDFDCCSQNLHKNCLLLPVQKLQEFRDSSQKSFGMYTNQLKTFYENIIKQINSDYNELKNWTQKHKQRQRVLAHDLELQKSVSGDFLSKLADVWNIFSEGPWNDIQDEEIQIQKSIQKQINALRKMHNRTKTRISEDRASNNRNSNNSSAGFDIYSSIVWKQEDIKTLQKIMSSSQGRVESFKCLYKASQNNFSAEKFHKLCDGVQNTLVLMKTSKDKIVGGFTPVSWEFKQHGQYSEDDQERSFVFSISNQQKYHLSEKQFAIEYNKNCGPVFGRGAALWIYDNANQNSAYWHILPTSYLPQNGKWTEQAFEDFVGAKIYEKYTVQQWEVFQVIFQ